MTLHCPKCKAGVGSLNAFLYRLELGVQLQVVRCVLCGWEVSRPAPTERYTVTVRPQPSRPQSQPKPRQAHFTRKPCTRVGCDGTFADIPNITKFNLCPECSRQIQQWKRTSMNTPPPYLYQDGVWIDNPNRAKNQKRRAA